MPNVFSLVALSVIPSDLIAPWLGMLAAIGAHTVEIVESQTDHYDPFLHTHIVSVYGATNGEIMCFYDENGRAVVSSDPVDVSDAFAQFA